MNGRLDERRRVRERRAHRLPFAGAVAVVQRQQDAERREMAAADIAHGERHHRRLALLVVPSILQARDCLAELLATAPHAPLPQVAERADRRVHDAREPRRAASASPMPSRSATPSAKFWLTTSASASRRADDVPAFGRLQVEQHRALAGVDPHVPRDRDVFGLVDLDDVGAVLGEHPTGGRAGEHVGEVDHAHALERRGRVAVRSQSVGARRSEGRRAAESRGDAETSGVRLSTTGCPSCAVDPSTGSTTSATAWLSRPPSSIRSHSSVVWQTAHGAPVRSLIVVLPLGCVPSAEQLGESLDQLDLQLGLGAEPIGLGDALGEPLRHELPREPSHVPVLEEAEVKPAAVLALVVPETRPRRRLERTRGDVVRHLQLVAEDLVRRVEQRHLDTLALDRTDRGRAARPRRHARRSRRRTSTAAASPRTTGRCR